MMGHQTMQPFIDQPQYTQPFFYQDSLQGQPQVFYLQPQPMQYSYSNSTSVCEGSEPLFTYSINQPQSTAITASMPLENADFDRVSYSCPIQSSDGSITPSITADPSVVMGSGGGFFADAPAMTISPTSLQRTPIDPEHSPLTSVSDTESFAPQQIDTEETSRKRRMSCAEIKELTMVSGRQDSGLAQAAPVSSRKRSRQDQGECSLTPSATTTPGSQSGSQDTTQNWETVDRVPDQPKTVLANTLRKQLGMSKKKHAPPGGFKPWNTSPASSHLPSGSDCINPITGEVSLPNLENLTKEEIRKVKNRASAQRSRTRKSEQAFELRLENAKLMERLESVKQVLRDARPDLCASMALDRPEPPLLSLDHAPAVHVDELSSQEDERSHMQMLIHGLRDQLDTERNQRIAAEQKIAKLQCQIKSLSTTIIDTPPISPPGVVVAKMTLDQVAERENALRIVDATSEMSQVEFDRNIPLSLSEAPAVCKFEPPPAHTRYAGPLKRSPSSAFLKREDHGGETLSAILPGNANEADLLFDLLIVMALLAMCAALREAASVEAKSTAPTNRLARDSRILDAIKCSTSLSAPTQVVSLTILKPLMPADDFERLSAATVSLQACTPDSDLDKVVQSWLGHSTSSHSFQRSPMGWLIVSPNTANTTSPSKDVPDSWKGSFNGSCMPDSDLFDTMTSDAMDARLGMGITTFPSLLAPGGALWQTGPSPTLAPLMVEDPFADIDCASDLSDLNSRTRASTVFEEQSSSLLSSRRTSIHSTWPHDVLAMTRSASALPTTAAVTAFEKTVSTKFAKFECEVEFSTEIVIRSARSCPAGAELLDRSRAARLLAGGNAFPQ